MILTRFNSVLYLHEQVSGHRQHDVTLCISQCILQTIGRARPVDSQRFTLCLCIGQCSVAVTVATLLRI